MLCNFNRNCSAKQSARSLGLNTDSVCVFLYILHSLFYKQRIKYYPSNIKIKKEGTATIKKIWVPRTQKILLKYLNFNRYNEI